MNRRHGKQYKKKTRYHRIGCHETGCRNIALRWSKNGEVEKRMITKGIVNKGTERKQLGIKRINGDRLSKKVMNFPRKRKKGRPRKICGKKKDL